MSSDHEDAPFEAYQKLRATAELDVKTRLFEWAMDGALDSLTLEDVRVIAAEMICAMNHHTRQVFELYRGTKK